ncbi:uncharacterized protein LOC129799061 [Phlebotomus papatasi]|uniref:uncharacterized protein LOC129799061 n=1 Tax=Phlebotomus papatasi TaxID=29031 RepID=UPI0024837E3C|nr:uncharacterized protein LOC129799061 [Phlebotomus papatasi]
MSVPENLNRNFFENVLKCGFKLKNFELISYDMQLASSPGDNYCSTIYRVVISYRGENGKDDKVQCIVKHIENSGASKVLLDNNNVYKKEVEMLKNIMPRLSELAGGTVFAPKLYYTVDLEDAKIVAMEDLGTNHKMVDRKLLLDFDHCEIVLKKLGQLHGASMVLAEETPSKMDLFTSGLITGSVENPGLAQAALSGNFPMLCETVKTWPGFEKISEKLEKLKPRIWTMFYEYAQMKNEKYRVLNHGDFWINNFLFKYDEKTGKPIHCIPIDLQFSYYTSPAHDLQYFLNSSPKLEVRENYREKLLRIYYEAFTETLENVKHKNIPTFDDLLEEMRKREIYGFFTMANVLPVVLMERQSDKGSGLDGLTNEESAKDMIKIMFTGKRYTESCKRSLKWFDSVKFFDV